MSAAFTIQEAQRLRSLRIELTPLQEELEALEKKAKDVMRSNGHVLCFGVFNLRLKRTERRRPLWAVLWLQDHSEEERQAVIEATPPSISESVVIE